jgi:hypothetical protein
MAVGYNVRARTDRPSTFAYSTHHGEPAVHTLVLKSIVE